MIVAGTEESELAVGNKAPYTLYLHAKQFSSVKKIRATLSLLLASSASAFSIPCLAMCVLKEGWRAKGVGK